MTDLGDTENTEALRHASLFDGLDNAVAVYRVVDEGRDFIIVDFNRAAERLERVS